MKKLRKLRLDDRSKLLLSCAIAAALLITAMLLPLAFRSAAGPEESKKSEPGAKRRLFADYWFLEPTEQGITVTKEETPRPETVRSCEAVMRDLVEDCIDDQMINYEVPDGSEYTVISDGSGVEVRLCRMWLEVQGDWQNWLDVCFDVESGELYYFYLSRECLTNRTKYGRKTQLDVLDVADSLAEAYGWTLRWLDTGGESGTALFTAGGGTACYQIDCVSYDTLIDVKLCCR